MKALIISALVFFSLRAMSAEVGESLGSNCAMTNQSSKREAKAVAPASTSTQETKQTSVSK